MRKLIYSLALSIVCSVFLNAQDFRTSYFLSNYLYDYRINPAFMGDSYRGFTSVGVGDVNVGVQASFPVSALVYKDYDGYQFGLSDGYSIEKLRNKLQNFNKMNVSISENIFAFGWNRGRTAGTLEVNLRSYTSGYFDYELARMAIEEYDGFPYGLENTKFNTRDWLEVAYGFSSHVSDSFSFGGRIKGLIGLNYSDLNVDYLYCDYDPYLVARSEGMFRSSNTFITFPTSNGMIGLQPEFGRYTIGGLGVSADLGFKLTTDRGIEIGVSALDLGGLMWHSKIFGTQDEDRRLNSLEDVYKFIEDDPASSTTFVMNPVTIEAGARYPISDVLSAGTLATIRIDNTARGWYEIRVGGSFTPAQAFSVAASAAMNTLGAGIGFALNFRVPGIAFSLGSDSLFGLFSFNSDLIPSRRLNTNLHAGLSIAW